MIFEFKRHTIDDLINAKTLKDRDEVKGGMFAESDLLKYIDTFKNDFTSMVENIRDKYVLNTENTSLQSILGTIEERAENTYIAQIVRSRELRDEFLAYAENQTKPTEASEESKS